MKRLKFQDVAARARVSPATVSRVVHGRTNVATDTKNRVLAAMREIGFSPDMIVVGLIVPDSSNPYFSDLCFRFEHVLEDMGAHLLVSSSEGRIERELKLVQRFRDLGVQGLIYTSSGQGSDGILNLIATDPFPVLVFDRRLPAGNLDTVMVNSRHGTLCAVDYLHTYGHERISYIKGLEGTETATERFNSFRDAMARNRLALKEDWIFEGNYTPASGRECAERLIQMSPNESPTAVLAANDLMAIGLMQRLQQDGWVLPRELSIIGFDDIGWSQWVYPALTTIAQPVDELVHEASRLLLRRIKDSESNEDPRRSPDTVQIKPKLIPRASVSSPFIGYAGRTGPKPLPHNT